MKAHPELGDPDTIDDQALEITAIARKANTEQGETAGSFIELPLMRQPKRGIDGLIAALVVCRTGR